jgi:hypothetical protein
VIVPSKQDLYAFVTTSAALAKATSVETTMVITALKRSGVLAAQLRSARSSDD